MMMKAWRIENKRGEEQATGCGEELAAFFISRPYLLEHFFSLVLRVGRGSTTVSGHPGIVWRTSKYTNIMEVRTGCLDVADTYLLHI
jgi:hypothetical protein